MLSSSFSAPQAAEITQLPAALGAFINNLPPAAAVEGAIPDVGDVIDIILSTDLSPAAIARACVELENHPQFGNGAGGQYGGPGGGNGGGDRGGYGDDRGDRGPDRFKRGRGGYDDRDGYEDRDGGQGQDVYAQRQRQRHRAK